MTQPINQKTYLFKRSLEIIGNEKEVTILLWLYEDKNMSTDAEIVFNSLIFLAED